MTDQELCGQAFILDGVDIIAWPGEVVNSVPDVELVCSLPWGHIPRDRHSDGVTDWIGDEAP